MPDDNSGIFIYQDSGGTDICGISPECHSAVLLYFANPKDAVDTIINQENDACFDSRHQASITGSFEV